jgi:LacI family transcriptional regulator
VADRAAVSSATISRALNDPDKVAPETRARIDAAILELGYSPNFGARVLASNRTGTVGAIVPTLSNAIFATGLQSFQDVLAESGITMLIATTDYDPTKELHQVRQLLAHGAAGLLLVGADRPWTTLDFIEKHGVPHVLGWCAHADRGQTCVGFDNAAAAYDATERVLIQGHRRIAMISGERKSNDRAQARVDGVRQAISDHGRGAALLSITEVKYRLQMGADAFVTAYDTRPHPTAIICGNDVLAAGAMMQAREMGLDIPGDVSIVGFDDIGLARAVQPGLTTVRVPQIEMGRQAAEVLLAKINGTPLPPNPKLKTEFIMRGTLAPPKKDIALR